MLGLIMAIIDTTIVNVALNTIGGNLGATVDEVAWVATGYILANVVVMPLNGWLTALLGRKRFYAASLALFTVASFLCGTARSIWLLVFYRVIQGIGGGALQPTAQAILFETYPPQKRGAAMAIFGLGAMVGPAIGPTLGGYIVDNASWPLIFYINMPIGIAAFFMTLAFIPEPEVPSKARKAASTGSGWACSPPASRRCSTCSSAASATTGFSRRRSHPDDRRGRHARAVRRQVAARPASDRRFDGL